MTVEDACVSGNYTGQCVPPSSSAGLFAGLTLLFLLVVMGAGAIVYKYHSSICKMLRFGHKRSHEVEDCAETAQADSQLDDTRMIRQQTTEQTPIYENLTTQTRHSRHAVEQSRSPSEPEESLYLQCDMQDDAIYSNDPACNLSILPDSQEEDVYIVPDS